MTFWRKTNKENELLIQAFRRKRTDEFSQYATFNRRMIAATIDSLVLLALAPVFDFLAPIDHADLNTITIDPESPHAASTIIHAILSNQPFVESWLNNFKLQMSFFLLYSGICWHFWQATPGKLLLGMRVVDFKTGGKPGSLQYLLRLCGYFISGSAAMLGFFWIGMNKRRRGWHDYLGETAVTVTPFDWKKLTDRLPQLAPKPPEPEKKDETPAD